ncbi:MAG TPA: tetratricopeptide repeat protein [Thermoanaerobaculia bacterium]|nr:tetratricopeptide repeat protein [Thermoanaerobaculia bacterium]
MIVQVPGLRRALLLVAGCALAAALRAQAPEVPAGAEAVSMFGEPLTEVPMSAGERQEREARYAEARTAAAARPDDVEAQIWLGRRAAYLGHIREAVDVFTRALARWPDDPRLLRHRGHRYITLRRFDLAVADLERASRLAARRPDEAEPDEIRSQAPGDTLRSNIWYHLGVAHYLAGEFAPALRAEEQCLLLPATPDREAAARFWSYLALRRLGRDVEARQTLAPIRPNMAVFENRAYLLLMMMYKGDLTPDALLAPGAAGDDPLDPAILRYGVGAWYLAEGKRDDAVRIDREVLALGQWHSFAHIAAEADLRRLGEGAHPAAATRSGSSSPAF